MPEAIVPMKAPDNVPAAVVNVSTMKCAIGEQLGSQGESKCPLATNFITHKVNASPAQEWLPFQQVTYY